MVRRPPLVRVGLALVALAALCRPAEADYTYLALGDSLAFGETDFTHNPSNGDRGYVSLFADHLATFNGGVRPNVVNLAFDGETTDSFFTGNGNVFGPSSTASVMNTNYGGVPAIQNDMLLSTIAAQHAANNQISYVTVSLGANDLYGLVGDPNFFGLSAADQMAKVAATLGVVGANYTKLLGELHTLVPEAQVVLVGYYNPFTALVGSPVATASVPAVLGLNSVIEGEAAGFSAININTYNSFLGHESSYTYILTQFLGNPNIHPNAQGYGVIAGQLDAVPEPGSLALLGAGLGLAGVAAVKRRRAAA